MQDPSCSRSICWRSRASLRHVDVDFRTSPGAIRDERPPLSPRAGLVSSRSAPRHVRQLLDGLLAERRALPRCQLTNPRWSRRIQTGIRQVAASARAAFRGSVSPEPGERSVDEHVDSTGRARRRSTYDGNEGNWLQPDPGWAGQCLRLPGRPCNAHAASQRSRGCRLAQVPRHSFHLGTGTELTRRLVSHSTSSPKRRVTARTHGHGAGVHTRDGSMFFCSARPRAQVNKRNLRDDTIHLMRTANNSTRVAARRAAGTHHGF